jgi:hypothetical protein
VKRGCRVPSHASTQRLRASALTLDQVSTDTACMAGLKVRPKPGTRPLTQRDIRCNCEAVAAINSSRTASRTKWARSFDGDIHHDWPIYIALGNPPSGARSPHSLDLILERRQPAQWDGQPHISRPDRRVPFPGVRCSTSARIAEWLAISLFRGKILQIVRVIDVDREPLDNRPDAENTLDIVN